MPFPTHLINNWVRHTVSGSTCTRCGLSGVPKQAVLEGIAYEKSGRYLLMVPQKFKDCQA